VALKTVSAVKRCTYNLSGVFSLDSSARFGYDIHYGNETRDLLVQFSGGINEQILSRDLASIRVQQETNSVSEHCELCRSVLTAPALVQVIPSRPTKGGFFYAPDYLTLISHNPPTAIAYLMPSPGLVLIADFDVFQYAFTRLTATSPGSVTIYAISPRSL